MSSNLSTSGKALPMVSADSNSAVLLLAVGGAGVLLSIVALVIIFMAYSSTSQMQNQLDLLAAKPDALNGQISGFPAMNKKLQNQINTVNSHLLVDEQHDAVGLISSTGRTIKFVKPWVTSDGTMSIGGGIEWDGGISGVQKVLIQPQQSTQLDHTVYTTIEYLDAAGTWHAINLNMSTGAVTTTQNATVPPQ